MRTSLEKANYCKHMLNLLAYAYVLIVRFMPELLVEADVST